jgi:hypothetical protein
VGCYLKTRDGLHLEPEQIGAGTVPSVAMWLCFGGRHVSNEAGLRAGSSDQARREWWAKVKRVESS